MAERDGGYYWIKFDETDDWMVGAWIGARWFIPGSAEAVAETEFAQIGPEIARLPHDWTPACCGTMRDWAGAGDLVLDISDAKGLCVGYIRH